MYVPTKKMHRKGTNLLVFLLLQPFGILFVSSAKEGNMPKQNWLREETITDIESIIKENIRGGMLPFQR